MAPLAGAKPGARRVPPVSLHSAINRLLPRPLRPVELATARYLRWAGGIVRGGPFRGLRYLDHAHYSALAPKLAGTYEAEIQPALAAMIAAGTDAFIDIGAAEGYYAVGAAFAGWCPRIVAFETDASARAGLAALLARNSLAADRVEVRGECTPAELAKLLGECRHPVVLMDVEGFEAFLLDPLRVPGLERCRIVVEYHDFVLPGLREEIGRRLGATHEITVIEQRPRTAAEIPCGDFLFRLFPAGIRRRVLGEQRPFSGHGWLTLVPRP
jgi:hypothetical protein